MSVDLTPLRRAVRGTVLGPEDEGWDAARAAWNLAVDQRPVAVVAAADADDVAAAAAFARDAGLPLTAQPTGHSATWSLSDAVLIRTASLADVEIDSAAKVARIGPGARWMDVQAAACELGLCGLSGTAGDVTATGFTLGGGLSWLGRRYGLCANAVRAFEVVTAGGERLRVDAEHEPDLFWAMRGGGGNYAIVTAMELGLVEHGEVYAGNLMFPLERAPEVLTAWRDWCAGAPEEASSIAALLRVPPLPTVPEPLRGAQLAVVDVTYAGDAEAGAAAIAPLRALGPFMDTVATIPASALGTIHNEPEDPLPFIADSAMLSGLPDEAIAALLAAAGPGVETPLLAVEVRHLGGALARRPEDAGAVGHLEDPFIAFGIGVPMGPPGAAEAIGGALRGTFGGLAAWISGRRFLNFVTSPEDVGSAFPPDVLARLQDVKRRYDPDARVLSSHPLPA
jgi:FAD/FMN-containing dehydrogenase